MNAVSAAILIATSTALTRALSVVPITSSQVTSADDQDGGHVDPAADLHRRLQIGAGRARRTQAATLRHQGVGVADRGGNMQPQRRRSSPTAMVRPADRDRAGADRIFEDQRPADHPGEQLADHRIGIGVGRARHRHHRGEFGIAERRDGADEAGDDEAEHHARARPSARLRTSARRCRCRSPRRCPAWSAGTRRASGAAPSSRRSPGSRRAT